MRNIFVFLSLFILKSIYKFISEKSKQIEYDEKLSKQLFDEINTRNPIDNKPVYSMSENPASLSLRQIMAEQETEHHKEKERVKKNQGFLFDKKTNLKYDSLKATLTAHTKHAFEEKKHTDYYNFENKSQDVTKNTTEYRSLAYKYSNLKQEYLRKASEAHKRGNTFVSFRYNN